MINPKTNQPYFPTQEDYEKSSDQPWVIEAASELAGIIYGLDPDYDNKLAENEFLKEFDFVNDDLRLVNDDGHLVDVDGDLIDEDSRYIKYRTEEVSWVRADLVERKPFLDDDGNPVISAKTEDAEKEEDLVAEKPAPKPKRRRKSTKVETDTETT